MAGTVEFNTENALYREFQKNKDMMEQIARDKHILRTGEGIYAPLWVQNRLVGLLYLDERKYIDSWDRSFRFLLITLLLPLKI